MRRPPPGSPACARTMALPSTSTMSTSRDADAGPVMALTVCQGPSFTSCGSSNVRAVGSERAKAALRPHRPPPSPRTWMRYCSSTMRTISTPKLMPRQMTPAAVSRACDRDRRRATTSQWAQSVGPHSSRPRCCPHPSLGRTSPYALMLHPTAERMTAAIWLVSGILRPVPQSARSVSSGSSARAISMNATCDGASPQRC